MKLEVGKLSELSKHRSYLFPGVVVILILVSAMTILKPKLNDLLETRRGLAKQKQELAQLTQKVALLEGYDQNELNTRVNQILKVLPTEKDGPLILATVRSLVADYDLELESLNVEVGEIATEAAEPKRKEELLPSLSIKLSVTGSLDNLYNFLEAVESTTPLMMIDLVSVNREGTTIESSIQLSTYYLAAPKDIGKAGRQITPITSEEEEVYQKLSRYQSPSVGTSLPYVGSGKENPFTL